MKLEIFLSTAEDKLSAGAAIPLVGVIPGVAKVGMGAIQLVNGAVAGAFFALRSLSDATYKPLRDRAVTHIAHGAANMVAGVFEAIPFVGFIIYMVRDVKSTPVAPKLTEMEKLNHNQMRKMTDSTRTSGPVKSVYHDPALAGLRAKGHTPIAVTSSDIMRARYGADSFKADITNYHLVSPNSTKFMGYKILEPIGYYQHEKAYNAIRRNLPVDEATNEKIPFPEKDAFKKKNQGARFIEAGWGPLLKL